MLLCISSSFSFTCSISFKETIDCTLLILVFKTEEEADKNARDILNFYKDFLENMLAVPVIAGKKSQSLGVTQAACINSVNNQILELYVMLELGLKIPIEYRITATMTIIKMAQP